MSSLNASQMAMPPRARDKHGGSILITQRERGCPGKRSFARRTDAEKLKKYENQWQRTPSTPAGIRGKSRSEHFVTGEPDRVCYESLTPTAKPAKLALTGLFSVISDAAITSRYHWLKFSALGVMRREVASPAPDPPCVFKDVRIHVAYQPMCVRARVCVCLSALAAPTS